MHDSEQRIRERAYAIWEQEGRPDGREHVHWERARLLVEMEASAIEAEARQPDDPFPGEGVNHAATQAVGRTPSRPRAKPRVSAREKPPAAEAGAGETRSRASRDAKDVRQVSPSQKKASLASRSRNAGKSEAVQAPE